MRTDEPPPGRMMAHAPKLRPLWRVISLVFLVLWTVGALNGLWMAVSDVLVPDEKFEGLGLALGGTAFVICALLALPWAVAL